MNINQMPLRDTLHDHLLNLEEVFHEHYGWDHEGDGFLFTVTVRDRDTLGFYMVPYSFPRAVRDLFRFTRLLVERGFEEQEKIHRAVMTYEPPVAFAFIYTTRKLSSAHDTGDPVLTRVMFTMDLQGQVYYAARRNGGEVFEMPVNVDSDSLTLAGMLPHALRSLCILAVDQHEREHRADFLKALGDVEILPPHEAAQRYKDVDLATRNGIWDSQI